MRVRALAGCVLLCFGLCGCSTTPPADPGPTPPPDDEEDVSVAREIEEADIIKVEGSNLYVANPYTGLRIIDVSTVGVPKLRGAYPLAGRAIELYQRDNHVFVFTAADFAYCAGEPVGFDSDVWENTTQPAYTGSRLSIIDVSDPDAPSLTASSNFAGFTVGTRLVGDVLYAAGNVGSNVFVLAINIAEPDAPQVVDDTRLSGTSLDIHVDSEAIYVIGPDETVAGTSLVTYVDISDPAGQIVVRDQFRVPGEVRNRFFTDTYDDVFRIITEEFNFDTFTRVVALFTYDVSNPNEITRLARKTIVTDESLRAVRFDGTRAYAVTFLSVDPLFVLDLSDPADPQVAGELVVPGFSTYLVPLGERLVGVGYDGSGAARPAVSLYDVSNPAVPKQLSRITITAEDAWAITSSAIVDEKALRVLEDAGLILLPYAVLDSESGEFIDALQLIAMQNDRLVQAGRIEHRGLVRRANLIDNANAWVLSDLAFQVIDIADLQKPKSVEMLELITDQELLDAGLSACVDSARYSGTDLGSFWFFPGAFFCGAQTPVMFALTFLGLGVLRYRLLRTRE